MGRCHVTNYGRDRFCYVDWVLSPNVQSETGSHLGVASAPVG